MSTVQKFFLSAFGIALVVLLITISSNAAQKGKSDTDTNIEQYGTMAKDYEDIALNSFDGTTVSGNFLKDDIIKRYKDEIISIKVINGKGNTSDYIYASTVAADGVVTIGAASTTSIATNSSATNYINDFGDFKCEVLYDGNDTVACLRFSQQ